MINATALPRASSVNVHAIDPHSRANGPGIRFVVWMQGCTLGCPGCFNPGTHDPGAVAPPSAKPTGSPPRRAGGRVVPVDELASQMAKAGVEGLSLSGGEPLQQPAAAFALLDTARKLGLSTLAFSGYTIDEIRSLPGGTDVLSRLDVLVDGRYIAGDRLAVGLRGSANQTIHLLSGRYTIEQVEATPVAEIVIGPSGELVLTGVDPIKLKR